MSGLYFLNDWEADIVDELRLARADRDAGRGLDAEHHQENVRNAVAAVDENEADTDANAALRRGEPVACLRLLAVWIQKRKENEE